MQNPDTGLAFLRHNNRNGMSAPGGLKSAPAGLRSWAWAVVQTVVFAGLVAGCGPKQLVDSNLPPPPGRAIIEGSQTIAMFAHSITAIETVDDHPAAAFMCGRELKESSFWTGQKYGGWWCLDPSDAGTRAAQGDPVASLVGVDPGPHKIVVVRDVVSQVPCGLGTCPSNHPGFVHRAELIIVAEADHKYQVLSESSGDRYFAWIVDQFSARLLPASRRPSDRRNECPTGREPSGALDSYTLVDTRHGLCVH